MARIDTMETFTASLQVASILTVQRVLDGARKTAVPNALRYARQTVAVASGETHDTIKTKAYKRGDEVFIEAKAKGAGLYLEFGTVNMPPQPFLFPALRKTQDPMVDLMADIGEAVLAGWGERAAVRKALAKEGGAG